MALYRVERQLPEGAVTDDDVDAAAYRAVACLARFPEITWVRSYFDPQAYHFTCYYQAEDPEVIRKHAEMAGIPCDSITEVREYLPDAYR